MTASDSVLFKKTKKKTGKEKSTDGGRRRLYFSSNFLNVSEIRRQNSAPRSINYPENLQNQSGRVQRPEKKRYLRIKEISKSTVSTKRFV